MVSRLSVAVIVGLCMAACADPLVDPFDTGKHFTVYGYLSPLESDHVVRVIPVRRYPEHIIGPGGDGSEIDAEVFSTNLSTDETIRWDHSLTRLNDGSYGHVFSSHFVVNAGVTYRLTVRRSDGAESVAETHVPRNVTAEALPAVVSGDTIVQPIRLKNVPMIERLYVVYCASPVDGPVCADDLDGKTGLIIIYLGRRGHRVGADWEIGVQLSRDFHLLRDIAHLEDNVPLILKSLELRVTALDPKWIVADDPEEFAQPYALNNVSNGFGYWGSLGVGEFEWVPDADILDALGVSTAE